MFRFSQKCFQFFHFFFAPFLGLSWDAALLKIGVRLELLINIEIIFCEFAIRGGVSQCCHRYAKANNVYMGSDFNLQEEIKYLSYLDADNSYG